MPDLVSLSSIKTLLGIIGNAVGTGNANIFTDTQTINKTSQSSTAELILKTTVSDDATGYFQIENTSSTNGIFSSGIRALCGTNATSLFILGETTVGNDTGINPVVIIDVRRTPNAGVATRPLFALRNSGTVALQIEADRTVSISPTWATDIVLNNSIALRGKDSGGTIRNLIRYTGDDVYVSNYHATGDMYLVTGGNSVAAITETGQFSFIKTAQASTAEILAEWRVSDSANTSYIRFSNLSTVDAVFRPRIILHNSDDTGANEIVPQVTAAMDSGTNAVCRFNIRRDNGTAIVTRPLFDITNNAVSLFKVNVNGDVLHTITAQAGVFEEIYKWTISDDTNSYFHIWNGSGTDSQMSVVLEQVLSSNVPSTVPSITIRANIASGSDSGTSAAMIFDSRIPGADIAVRPLFEFRNRNTNILRINTKGDILQTIMSQAGVAETIHVWKVSDEATSSVNISNASSTDAIFTPWLRFTDNKTSTGIAAFISTYINATADSGTNPVMRIDARQLGEADITTRPILGIYNRQTLLTTIDNEGRLTLSHQDEGSTERLMDISLSDAAGSYFRIENNLGGVAGDFAPMLRGHRATADNSFSGLYIQGSINSVTEDTGASAVITIDARAGTGGTLTTRPLLVIRNAASIRYTFGVTGMTFTDTMNIGFSTATGTKIGTGTTQKIGFWNATPVAQPAANPDTSGASLAALETEVNELKALLRSVGFMA